MLFYKELSFKSTLVRDYLDSDVFAVNKNVVYDLAYAVSGRYPVGPEIDSGKKIRSVITAIIIHIQRMVHIFFIYGRGNFEILYERVVC